MAERLVLTLGDCSPGDLVLLLPVRRDPLCSNEPVVGRCPYPYATVGVRRDEWVPLIFSNSDPEHPQSMELFAPHHSMPVEIFSLAAHIAWDATN